jgi:hypothetical protein
MEATKRHREEKTVLEAIEIGLRAGLPVDQLEQEWDRFVGLKIVESSSSPAQLVLAKIRNQRAGEALASRDAAARARVLVELMEVRQSLSKWMSDDNLPEGLQNAGKANFALAYIYCWAHGSPNGDDSDARETDIEAAYRHARDAEFYFKEQLADLDPAQDTPPIIGNREALVASRIALGHLAAMHLDDWRDESQIFFAAAAAEAAKIEMAFPVMPLIGGPLLDQVFGQSEGGYVKLANEERQRRHMVTRCIEAMFTLRFGEPLAGAKQMEEAVESGTAAGGDKKGQLVDAAELSAGADGFDAQVTLPDTVRAFGVLSDVEAKRFSQAVAKAVSLASKNKVMVADVMALTSEQLAECLESIQSPLVAFSYAKALEAYAVQIPLAESLELRSLLLEASLKAYERGAQFLEAERLSARFPHVVALINNATANLTSPDVYREQVVDLAASRRLPEAIALATDGLGRHPKHQGLWRAYFQAQIEQARITLGDDPEGLKRLVTELTTTRERDLLSAYEAAFNTATILELMDKRMEAELKYKEAQGLAANPQERIQATSNAARLRVALAFE